MKKYYKIIFILILFFISCGNLVNPTKQNYYYNNKTHTTTDKQPTIDIDSEDDKIDPSKDPFIKGEWNSQNYKFNGSLIKDYFFGASFDSQNVPIYKFFLDYERSWQIDDINYKGYKYDGSKDGNKAQGYSISPADFYKYEGINPLVLYNSSYNKSDRMKRFIFYRLDGKAVIVPLNNYLIAVDTYSKFVFAYGKITQTKNAFGKPYPTEFQAVEKYGDKRKFYEYDPIGIMVYDETKKELKLNLYKEYQEEMAKNANEFFPTIHDISRGLASESGPGLSPYYVSDSDLTADEITITAKSLKNISVKSAEGYLKIVTPKFDDIRNYGYFTYGIGGVIYDIDLPSGIEYLDKLKEDGASVFDKPDSIAKINLQEKIDFSGSKKFEVNNIKDKEICIELASDVRKYNTLTALGLTYVDTDNFGKGGSGKMATKDSPKVKLKYNSSKKAFVVDGSSINENKDTSVSITYDKNFTLKRGEKKDFTIKYNWKKGNDTENGEEFEITYNLEFKSVS